MKRLLALNKYRFLEGVEDRVLDEVRSWEYGVLLLSPQQGRGIDTRFRRTALVMIACEVASMHEVQQMVGRSCRTRGVCQGTLYHVGQERAHHVMDRLKRHSASAL